MRTISLQTFPALRMVFIQPHEMSCFTIKMKSSFQEPVPQVMKIREHMSVFCLMHVRMHNSPQIRETDYLNTAEIAFSIQQHAVFVQTRIV